MSGFFAHGKEEMQELKALLEWFYPEVPAKDYNLEEVMAYLELSRIRTRLWGINRQTNESFDPAVLFDSLLAYVRHRLTSGTDPCKLHMRLFKGLVQTDSVITLNYDLVADRALASIESADKPAITRENSRMAKMHSVIGHATFFGGTPPFLVEHELAWGFYLKLHGSLDWVYCTNPTCSNNVNLFPLQDKEYFSFDRIEQVPCRFCGSALQIYLIPPVATKRLEDRGRLAFIWNLALREIASATDLAIIGISFAPNDFEFRWLIRQALSQANHQVNLHIVNPDPECRKKTKQTLPGASIVSREYDNIDSYLNGDQVHQPA